MSPKTSKIAGVAALVLMAMSGQDIEALQALGVGDLSAAADGGLIVMAGLILRGLAHVMQRLDRIEQAQGAVLVHLGINEARIAAVEAAETKKAHPARPALILPMGATPHASESTNP